MSEAQVVLDLLKRVQQEAAFRQRAEQRLSALEAHAAELLQSYAATRLELDNLRLRLERLERQGEPPGDSFF
jgi:regulator of replication initiation timing